MSFTEPNRGLQSTPKCAFLTTVEAEFIPRRRLIEMPPISLKQAA